MIGVLILMSVIFAGSFFGAIACFIKKNYPIGFFLILVSIVSGGFDWLLIDAAKKDNTQTVEYSFSADHYTFDKVVTVTYKEVYHNGVKMIEEQSDTTYVLTGTEPIFNEAPNYKRKVLE